MQSSPQTRKSQTSKLVQFHAPVKPPLWGGIDTISESRAGKRGESSSRLCQLQENMAWLVLCSPSCASSGLRQTLSGSTQSEIVFPPQLCFSGGFSPFNWMKRKYSTEESSEIKECGVWKCKTMFLLTTFKSDDNF